MSTTNKGWDTDHLFPTVTINDCVGVTLGRLGFHIERHAGGSEHVAPWYAKNEVRVVVEEQVEVFVFTDKRRAILAWKCTFDLATPAEVVASCLLKIVGG